MYNCKIIHKGVAIQNLCCCFTSYIQRILNGNEVGFQNTAFMGEQGKNNTHKQHTSYTQKVTCMLLSMIMISDCFVIHPVHDSRSIIKSICSFINAGNNKMQLLLVDIGIGIQLLKQ